MIEKKKAAEAALLTDVANVHNQNDMTKETYKKFLVDLSAEIDKTEEFLKDWEVERDGTMVSKVMPYYVISSDTLTEEDWIAHMLSKELVDMNTFIPAYFYALKKRGIRELRITVDY